MDIIKLKDFNKIYAVKQFKKEWQSLFKNDVKIKQRYKNWLVTCLSMLDVDPKFTTNNDHIHFEPVENSHPSIHSIHGKSQKNPRVLYYLINEKNEVVLLTAFVENKKADYVPATKRAEHRAKSILKGECSYEI